MIGEATKKLIEEIKVEKGVAAKPLKVLADLKEENSMKYKHSQLLSAKKELVLPSSYKRLMEL